MQITKFCKACGLSKPWDDDPAIRNKKASGFYQAKCWSCNQIYMREHARQFQARFRSTPEGREYTRMHGRKAAAKLTKSPLTGELVTKAIARYHILISTPEGREKRKQYSEKFLTSEKSKTAKTKYYLASREKLRNDPEAYAKHLLRSRVAAAKRYASGAYTTYYAENPIKKLACNLRALLRTSFKRRNWGKQTKTQKLLGCSFEEFKVHIEQQFLPGMTWENHGAWHYDHIIPCDCAENILELEALQHWSNFRPLWGCDNLSKGATPPDNWKERLAELVALLDK